jgi:hypothetical protein
VVKTKVYADPGQDVALLDCYVHGEPFPRVGKYFLEIVTLSIWPLETQVQWKHQTNGQRPSLTNSQSRLFTNLEGNRSVLKIRRIDERDYGTYECSAHNNEGTAMGEIELTGKLGLCDWDRFHSAIQCQWSAFLSVCLSVCRSVPAGVNGAHA